MPSRVEEIPVLDVILTWNICSILRLQQCSRQTGSDLAGADKYENVFCI